MDENAGLNPSLLKSDTTIGTVLLHIPESSKGDGGDRARGTWGRASSGELMYRRKGSGHSPRMRWEKAAEGSASDTGGSSHCVCSISFILKHLGFVFCFSTTFCKVFFYLYQGMDPLACEMDI